LKLALLTPHHAPHFEGGTELFVRTQARQLADFGYDVRVVAGTDQAHAGVDVLTEEVDGFPVHFLPRKPDEFYDLLLDRPRIRELVCRLTDDCDVVHLHNWTTLDREVVRRISRTKPVVVTLHDFFVSCPRFFRIPVGPVKACPEPGDFDPCVRCAAVDLAHVPESKLLEGFQGRYEHFRLELEAARAIVSPSQAHLDRVALHMPIDRSRVHIVAPGMVKPLRRLDSVPAWTGEGNLRVAAFGHLSEVKGVLDLVEAVAGLGQLAQRVELAFYGEIVEDYFEERLMRAAEGLTLHMRGAYDLDSLPGQIAEEGVPHVVAAPSRAYESYGLVVDEALALGLPVWVSDRGAPKERIGAGGRVLPACDPAAWTAALRSVFDDPAALERERGAVAIHARTAREAARDIERVYQELLSPAP